MDQPDGNTENQTEDQPADPTKRRRVRRRKRRVPRGNLHRVTATIENEENAFDFPQDANDADRVATPDMMQHLMQVCDNIHIQIVFELDII